jgi:probable HAF family extracellular repeat protein
MGVLTHRPCKITISMWAHLPKGVLHMRKPKTPSISALVAVTASGLVGFAADAATTYNSVQLNFTTGNRTYLAVDNSTLILTMRQDSPALQDLNIVVENWSNGGANYSEFRPGTLPGTTRSIAKAFNDSGAIVGFAETADANGNIYAANGFTRLLPQRAFVYRNGEFIDLSALPPLNTAHGSEATAINNQGEVAGHWTDANGTHAFLYRNGTIVTLGSLSAPDDTTSKTINNSGQVAGNSRVAGGNRFPHTFLYDQGKFSDIGILAGWEWTETVDMNDSGTIVGGLRRGNHENACFIYANGVMKDMGVVGSAGSTSCRVSQINNQGVVVGDSSETPRPPHLESRTAALYENGKMVNLNSLISPTDALVRNNVRLKNAIAINDRGEIIATNGSGTYYLLTPVQASIDTADYNFESGTQGWASTAEPIINVSTSTERAQAGLSSLAVQILNSGFASVAVPNPQASPGQTVEFHVYLPAGANIDWIQPFALENESGGWRWNGAWRPVSALQLGAWNTLTVTLPNDAAPLASIGVELFMSQPYSGTVHIDAVDVD